MKQPCELVVWYVIPTARSILSKELFNLGMKQKEISDLLDITQPAVSQYLSDKRGGREIELTDEIKKMIEELAFKLSEGLASKKDIIAEICEICRKARTEDILCQLHRSKDEIPDDCNQCMDPDEESYCPHSFTYAI
ncbi:MAG: transcriptional regulator [Methanobrevibacter sp.]|nr:transcriptional regulator [Candidatus Methanovirga aequatorialis]